MKKCNQCNELIQSHHIYCPNCGNESKSSKSVNKSSKKYKHSSSPNNSAQKNSHYPIVIGVVILVAFAGIYWINQNYSRYSQGQFVTISVKSSAINSHTSQISHDSEMYQVAAYFECSCGDCQDPELVTCGCPTAKSQRDFIQKHLDEGKSVKEVRILVSQIFGKLKPEYHDSLERN
ncbi:MAG: hypothetical protein P9L94_11675 [Candidatus Hinthialibacter antarcticus]|nr:hypothetical protein [Candidatus Hinthialibacter antarcticus]